MENKSNVTSSIPRLPLILEDQLPEEEALVDNNQQSAKKAIKILEANDSTFKSLKSSEKKNLIIAFATKDKIVYGKAFDIIKVENGANVNFSDINDIEKNIKNIIVCEIKSTRKNLKRTNFEGYFFGLSTAELLVAQNLKENYRFVFVNINTREVMELTLKKLFEKAKGIYPQWSISF
jgi:hypothetical protein